MIARIINFVWQILTLQPRERWATGPVQCSRCASDHVAVVSTRSKCYDAKTGAISHVECPICGAMAASSE